jgi:predicted nuclease of restriction endonuclease-like RecB superfamily
VRLVFADYLARKLERLRRARISNLLVCLDEDRNVGPDELPADAAVVRYRRRVDAACVLAIIQDH